MRTFIAAPLICLLAVPAGAVSTLDIAGVFTSSAETIDSTRERIIFSGGSPKVKLIKEKTTLEAAEITFYLAKPAEAKAQDQRISVERVELRGGKPKVISEKEGFTLDAASISFALSGAEGAGAFRFASARGNVNFIQSQGENSSDATAEALELTENGDKAVLTGGVVVNWKSATYSGTLTGDKATITGLLPKGGQPANPRIVVESEKEGSSHFTAQPKGTGS